MPRPQQQIPQMSQRASRGGGGGGSSAAEVAMAGLVQDQQAMTQKLMANFQKVQEGQAEDTRANAMQMTEAMNQVVRRQDEDVSKEEARKEKMKDREYAEEFAVWSKQLDEDAAKDQWAMTERISQQTNAVRAFITKWDTDQGNFGNYINAIQGRARDLAAQGYWEKAPGGVERYGEILGAIRSAREMQEHNLQGDYSTKAMRLLNQTRLDIAEGRDYQDLTPITEFDPMMEQMSDTSGTPDSPLANLSEDDALSLERNGGYPPGGLYGRDPSDPEVAKYNNFNMMDYRTYMEMIEDEQALAIMHSERDRERWLLHKMKKVRDTNDYLKPLLEFETQSYDSMNRRAPEAVMFGVDSFVDKIGAGELVGKAAFLQNSELRPTGVMDKLSHHLLESTLLEVLGPNSEGIMKTLEGVMAPGEKREVLDTPAEWYKAVHTLNSLRIIDQQLSQASIGPAAGTEGKSQTAKIANALAKSGVSGPYRGLIQGLLMRTGDIPRGKLARGAEYYVAEADMFPPDVRLGRYSPATILRIQNGVERLFGETQSLVQDLMQAVKSQPVLRSVRADTRWMGQYGDALAFSYMSNRDETGAVVGLGEKDIAAMKTRYEGEGMEGDVGDMGIEQYIAREELSITPLMSTAQILGDFHNRRDLVPTIFAGGYEEDLPNFGGDAAANLTDVQAWYAQHRQSIADILKKRQQEQQPTEEAAPAQPQQPVPREGAM